MNKKDDIESLYDYWNDLKKQLNVKEHIIKFRQGDIYFMSIGQNIGHESYGKKDLFLRPVLVYKKLTKTTFIGIPLTSKNKEGSYYFSFNYKKGITSTAMLNQMRVFDIRRTEYLSGHINKNIYENLRLKIINFLDITPPKKRGERPTRAKSTDILTNKTNNVKSPSILAIILARGGSKRLPRKNVLDLCGKPLISWTIEASKKSKYLNKIVVSSDDDEILNISQKEGCEIVKRPKELASDTASSFEAIKHTLSIYQDYEYVVLLQPTSPLRNEKHIDEAIELLKNKNADAVISVCEMEHSPLWSNTLNNDLNMENFLSDTILNKRSQDLEKYYRLNGAIYICKTDKLLDEETFFLKDNIFAYKMKREVSIDIDEEIDFIIARELIKKGKICH